MTTMIRSMVASRSGRKGRGGALNTVTGDSLCWWCRCASGDTDVVLVVDGDVVGIALDVGAEEDAGRGDNEEDVAEAAWWWAIGACVELKAASVLQVEALTTLL